MPTIDEYRHNVAAVMLAQLQGRDPTPEMSWLLAPTDLGSIPLENMSAVASHEVTNALLAGFGIVGWLLTYLEQFTDGSVEPDGASWLRRAIRDLENAADD